VAFQLHYPLMNEVHVDDFFIGGKDKSKKGKTGRSSTTSKERACIAVEITANGIGRAYIKKISDFSTASLRPIIETFCPKASLIVTDGWSGYKPFKKEFPTMQTKLSEDGKNFPELHTVIMLFKKFIKGIHHNVSSARLQNYMDEFCFRFNRKTHIANININLLNRMALAKPYKPHEEPLQTLKNAA
jgi:ISXO2-like transposase domain